MGNGTVVKSGIDHRGQCGSAQELQCRDRFSQNKSQFFKNFDNCKNLKFRQFVEIVETLHFFCENLKWKRS